MTNGFRSQKVRQRTPSNEGLTGSDAMPTSERMERDTHNVRLLKAAFQKDWDYLVQHGAFQHELKKDDRSQQSYEHLVGIGTLLLRQGENIKPKMPEVN